MDTKLLLAKVRDICREADQCAAAFSGQSGLVCPSGCGRCCESPEIITSPIECLLLAEGLLLQKETWLSSLATFISQNRTLPSPCPIYVSLGFGTGFCSRYEERALICRLFGRAASTENDGTVKFTPCEYQKKTRPGTFSEPPVYRSFLERLEQIEPSLGGRMRIAEAILRALQFLN